MNIKKSNKFKAFIIVLIVGLIFFGVGLGLLLNYKLTDKYYLTTTATITHIYTYHTGDDVSHTVLVSYEVDGDEYNDVQLGYYSSGMYIGKQITIQYNKDNPNIIRSKGEQIIFIVFLGIGGIMLLISILGIARRKKNDRLENAIIKDSYSRKFLAKVVGIDYDYSYLVNGYPVYKKLLCRFDFDGTKNEVYSARFKTNAVEANNMVVDVYNNSKYPDKFVVDLNSVRQKTEFDQLFDDEKNSNSDKNNSSNIGFEDGYETIYDDGTYSSDKSNRKNGIISRIKNEIKKNK